MDLTLLVADQTTQCRVGLLERVEQTAHVIGGDGDAVAVSRRAPERSWNVHGHGHDGSLLRRLSYAQVPLASIGKHRGDELARHELGCHRAGREGRGSGPGPGPETLL